MFLAWYWYIHTFFSVFAICFMIIKVFASKIFILLNNVSIKLGMLLQSHKLKTNKEVAKINIKTKSLDYNFGNVYT